jgi:hypothetical protein
MPPRLRPRHPRPAPVNHASSTVGHTPPGLGSRPRPRHLLPARPKFGFPPPPPLWTPPSPPYPTPTTTPTSYLCSICPAVKVQRSEFNVEVPVLEVSIGYFIGGDHIFGPDPSSQRCSTLGCNCRTRARHSPVSASLPCLHRSPSPPPSPRLRRSRLRPNLRCILFTYSPHGCCGILGKPSRPAPVREDDRIHVTLRRSSASRSDVYPRRSVGGFSGATPRPSNLTNAEIYSLQSSRNPTPRDPASTTTTSTPWSAAAPTSARPTRSASSAPAPAPRCARRTTRTTRPSPSTRSPWRMRCSAW